MEQTCKVPRLVFPEGFTDRDEWEMERKGFVHAFLECEDGRRYQIMFIDPVRLAQDVEASLQSGQPYYYEFRSWAAIGGGGKQTASFFSIFWLSVQVGHQLRPLSDEFGQVVVPEVTI